MNETTTPTLFKGTEDKQMFAEVITHVVEVQHKDDIQIANIPFGIKRCEDIDRFRNKISIGNLQKIAKMYGKSREERDDWEVLKGIAEQLFDVFEHIDEIKKYSEEIYQLHEDGVIYKHLGEKLETSKHERHNPL